MKKNYVQIAKLFEELSVEFRNLSEQEEQEEQVADIQTSDSRRNKTLSEELFFEIVDVYVQETKRKSNFELKRKSGVLLAKNSNKVYIDFLSNNLPNGYTVSVLEDNPTFIIIRYEQKPKAILRFISDLGYQRGLSFGTNELTEIKNISKKLDISEEQIYVVVLSIINSLDEKDVKTKLKDPSITNRQLLDDRKKLTEYVSLYIESFEGIITNAAEHIFVMSYSLHPNRMADELCSGQKSICDYRSNEIQDVIPRILSNIVI